MLSSELFTIFWCNSQLITVQFRKNFCSQQIGFSFWCNIRQNFLECRLCKINSKRKRGMRIKCVNYYYCFFFFLFFLHLFYIALQFDQRIFVMKSWSNSIIKSVWLSGLFITAVFSPKTVCYTTEISVKYFLNTYLKCLRRKTI